MTASGPRNLNSDEWLANEHVSGIPDGIRLGSGFWHTELKLPLTVNLRTCHDDHHVYALYRYKDFFSSPEWINPQGLTLPEISDGILHLGSASHYHYLLHGLGNLSREVLREAENLFVDSDYSDDQVGFLKEALRARSAKTINVVRILPGTYRVTNVVVPRNKPHVDRVKLVRHSIGIVHADRDQERQRLYVTRRRTVSRHLANEDEFLEKMKSAYDFRVIENEGLSLREQVENYSGAEFVIGPHGAGLTNIIFAGNPRGMLEFWHSKKQPFFENISRDVGASYVAARGRPVSIDVAVGDRPDNSPFVVDPDFALKAIEMLVTKSPPRQDPPADAAAPGND